MEADKKIQDAAKRVLKENERLRAFISSRGIPSVEANTFCMEDGSSPDSTAVITLQQAMQTREILHKPSPGAQGDDCQTNLLQQSSTASPQYLGPCTSVQVKLDPTLGSSSDPSQDPAALLSTSMTTLPSALSNNSYQAHGPCGQPLDMRNDMLYQKHGIQSWAQYKQYLATCYSQYWPMGYMC